ncbi:MAG: tRNA (adenosine(37)-N6)-dimethylallyltransferase MiaA [Holosporaceae bacterium]|nr:tRNA (adenosine(37)-N6)-dimethylallyltransferase MiaA [Holosporaceae bacterium]
MVEDLIVLTGPTATGKSNLAVWLAEYLCRERGQWAEIINADSVQQYNGLKILTAVPSEETMRRVPHHLYEILSPDEETTAVAWADLARAKIQQLREEGKRAIVCGGTGLYINTLLHGISNIPKIPKDLRQEIIEKFKKIGRDAFFEQLAERDPELGRALHKNDTQRILRAYEVEAYTGKPLSKWWKNDEKKCNIFPIILLPPREELVRRCLIRTEKIVRHGVVDEMKAFVAKHPDYDGPLTRAIGYREITLFLKQSVSITECIRLIHLKTRQYAKRQRTWFRYQMKSNCAINAFGDEIVDNRQMQESFLKLIDQRM